MYIKKKIWLKSMRVFCTLFCTLCYDSCVHQFTTKRMINTLCEDVFKNYKSLNLLVVVDVHEAVSVQGPVLPPGFKTKETRPET